MLVEKSKRREIINQCLLWAGIVIGLNILFYAPDYIRYESTPYDWFLQSDPGLLIAGTLAPFIAIVHYYWLYEGYLAKKKYSTYLLLLIPFAVFMVLTNFLFHLPGFFVNMRKDWINLVIIGKVTGAIGIVDIPFMLFYTAVMAAKDLKERRRKLEIERQKTAILLLKNQMEPHFLFNTLNAIYAIAQKERANKTLAGIEELSGIVRYAAETADKEKVSVADELKFAEQYLYLQEMFADHNSRINLTHTINWDREPANISPMLLLPFADHAISCRQRNGSCTFNVSIEKGVLHMVIQNPITDNEERKDSLTNASKRLELEYTNSYQFKEKNENGNSLVNIDIDLATQTSINR